MTSSFIQYFQSTVTIWRINVEIWKYKIRKRHYLSDCQTLLKQRNPIQLNSALIQILQLNAISASKSTFHYIGLCSIIGKTRSRITRSLSWTSTTATRLRKERAECLLSLLFQLFSLFTWLSFLYFSSYHSSLCYLFFYLSSFFFLFFQHSQFSYLYAHGVLPDDCSSSQMVNPFHSFSQLIYPPFSFLLCPNGRFGKSRSNCPCAMIDLCYRNLLLTYWSTITAMVDFIMAPTIHVIQPKRWTIIVITINLYAQMFRFHSIQLVTR